MTYHYNLYVSVLLLLGCEQLHLGTYTLILWELAMHV